MKKILPVVYLLGLLALVFFAQRWLEAMRQTAGSTFQFIPLMISSTLVNLIVMLLLMGLAFFLWSQPRAHRPAAWAFIVIGLLTALLPALYFTGALNLAAPINRWFSEFTRAFWPLALPGIVAAGAAAAGLLHLLLRRQTG